jgi:predicted thioesterase
MEANMKELSIGDTFTSELIVEEKHTAAAFGSGNLFVFSTPMMIGLMENAALNCAQLGLEDGFSTVGTSLDVKHLAATPMGQKVSATAELIEIDNKKLTFRVEAFDAVEKIGEGTHGRYVIDSKKFLERVEQKQTNK